MELTLENVLEKLEAAVSAEIIDDLFYINDFDELEKFTGFEIKKVFGGRVGSDYDTYKLVYEIKNDDNTLLICICGYYNSNEGTDFDGEEWYVVKEVEKTIKIYEKI